MQQAPDWAVPLAQAQAVELLCRCDDIADEGVELRVLKGLLTAVTSNSLHVHGQALLLVRGPPLPPLPPPLPARARPGSAAGARPLPPARQSLACMAYWSWVLQVHPALWMQATPSGGRCLHAQLCMRAHFWGTGVPYDGPR